MEAPNPVYVLLAVALVVGFIVFSHRTWRKNNWWGTDPNWPACQRCHTPKPKFPFRKPTLKEYLTGGWTCRTCGAKVDKLGRAHAS
jgi:hypothetical protein